MQFQLYACENIKILLPLPRFILLPFHLHEYLLHGILDTQISLLCLYRQFIINNSEFMTILIFVIRRGVGRNFFKNFIFVLLNEFYTGKMYIYI